MDFQPALATDVNIAIDSARQILLAMGAWSDNAKGAKYLAGQGGCEAPSVPGSRAVPAALPRYSVTPSVSARV